jgi:hypothetical protein
VLAERNGKYLHSESFIPSEPEINTLIFQEVSDGIDGFSSGEPASFATE